MDEAKAQTKPINFRAVVKHLQREGWSQRQLAEWSGVSHGRIGQLAMDDSADPKFSAGHALLSLLTPRAHKELVGYSRKYNGRSHVKPPISD